LKVSRAKVFEAEAKSPDSPIVHRNLADMGRVLNGLVYQKGAWTLHMLRRKVGDEAFWSGIREYYRRYRDRNATTADFRQILEAASGQDLGPFLGQWLDRSGVPRLGGSWRYDVAKREVEVTLRQGQPGEPYHLPVAIALRAAPPAGSNGNAPQRVDILERVDLTAKSATFRFASESAPADVVLDPGTDLLFEADPFTRQR
jgi:aminopeptidase N